MEMRERYRYCIERAGMFYRGFELVSGKDLWSANRSDAWRFRTKEDAQARAELIGGRCRIMIYDQLNNQARDIRDIHLIRQHKELVRMRREIEGIREVLEGILDSEIICREAIKKLLMAIGGGE